jgi:hypothetical protein
MRVIKNMKSKGASFSNQRRETHPSLNANLDPNGSCSFIHRLSWPAGRVVNTLPKRVSEWVRSRPGHIQTFVNKLLIQRGSVG